MHEPPDPVLPPLLYIGENTSVDLQVNTIGGQGRVPDKMSLPLHQALCERGPSNLSSLFQSLSSGAAGSDFQ